MAETPTIKIKAKMHRDGEGTATMGDVLDSFHDLRACVLELFEAADLDPSKTRELARDLGVNRGLAWRLSRMVRTEDSTSVAHDVPGKQSMARFAKLCQQRGADESLVAQMLESTEKYEELVAACSGSRKTLAMLLANRGEDASSQERERARRNLFEGACSVWGVQAQTRFVTVFLFPSPQNPEALSAAHITGYVGFRRLGERPWPLSYEALHDSEGKPYQMRKDPLDPTGYEEGQLQLLPDFCEPREPEIEVVEHGDYKCFNLAAGPVGNKGLTTCVFGSHLHEIYSRYSPPGNEELDTAGFMVLLQTPVERVVFDYFVHEDIRTVGEPITHLLDRLTYPHQNRESDFDKQSMAIDETHRTLTKGLRGAYTPNITWYPKLIEFASNKIDIPVERFNATRFEMQYPPISTTLSRRITLSRKP
ncbi:MAG: hypothetical protein ACF8MF_10165 [Phycisphaerales bacterium JB052]